LADDPRAGELTTTNYHWTKPTVGQSDDAWGGYLNADLDSIDSIVHGIDTRPPYVLPTASTTVLGGVKVDGTTVTAAGDGTLTASASGVSEAPTDGKLYSRQSLAWTPTVVPIGDNRIINGDMRIDQRNNGAVTTPTAPGYTVDRWRASVAAPSKLTFQRAANGPGMTATGWPNSLNIVTVATYTPAAGEGFSIAQIIEADMISDFGFGNAGQAKPITLSFAVNASIAGTYSGAIKNSDSTRSYPFTFSVPTALSWYFLSVTIPGDTGGTWVLGGNAAGLTVVFDLGGGANVRGPAGVWASASYSGVTGATSIMSTLNANFQLTGVKLEIGSVATPFNRQSLAKSLADCQRYFQAGTNIALEGYSGGASSTVGGTIWFQVMMRSSPTLTQSGVSYSNGSALALDQASPTACRALWTGNSASRSAISGLTFTASAEL
jgi:hypothetical protein